MNKHDYVVGIDAGGTKGLLVARNDMGHCVQFSGEGASLTRDGADETSRRLTKLVVEAFGDHDDARMAAVAVGLAGAGRTEERIAMTEMLRRRLPTMRYTAGFQLMVVPDGDIALEAALGRESGIAVIAGTGSLVMARLQDGMMERSGGWGRVLGDDGSGYSLGRSVMRVAAGHFDAGTTSAFHHMVASRLGIGNIHDLLRIVYSEELPLQNEPVALLFEAVESGLGEAREILKTETSLLARHIVRLADRAGTSLDHRIVLAGGLTGSAVYRENLSSAVEQCLDGWSISVSDNEPVEGAYALAEQLLSIRQ